MQADGFPEAPDAPTSRNLRSRRRAAGVPGWRERANDTPPEVIVPTYFAREHRRLDAQLHAHLLDAVSGNFSRAQLRLRRWRRALTAHIDIEEDRLLPHVPGNARWAARVYHLEHERIALLADDYAAHVDALVTHPPRGERSRREAVLALLEAAHALRHVLEHHHQREETALASELPNALQRAAWGCGEGRIG